MPRQIFSGSPESPYHLSVGAALLNGQGQVACHYFVRSQNSIYLLMRETLENNETPEGALSRGLAEEMGLRGEITGFLGSRITTFKVQGAPIQKTTIYFAAQFTGILPGGRSPDDPEAGSEIQWQTPEFLISQMKAQGKKLGPDADESEILERLLKV